VTTSTLTGQLLGYARVCADDQEAQLQRDAPAAAGCARIFEDEASGKNTDRPELRAAPDHARAGDTVCVWRPDRFARSLIDLVTMVGTLRKRGVGFEALAGALADVDPGAADGRLMPSGGRSHDRVRTLARQGAHSRRTGRSRGAGSYGRTPVRRR
jgi:DNA invertase Pin-like site-specific DNA recombinase